VIFQKCSSGDNPQMKSVIDNPSSQNVGDIEHNNISKKQPNATVESQDMAAKSSCPVAIPKPIVSNQLIPSIFFCKSSHYHAINLEIHKNNYYPKIFT
jgi:hypothetical protein